jgi:hypothetical protein
MSFSLFFSFFVSSTRLMMRPSLSTRFKANKPVDLNYDTKPKGKENGPEWDGRRECEWVRVERKGNERKRDAPAEDDGYPRTYQYKATL